MKYKVSHDALGTHLDWTHDRVTARMIDWFWSNMEKCFLLWHPSQHEPLEWPIAPRDGDPLGAIHNAPQTWNDGHRQNLYIRFERFEDVPEEIRDVICYEHVMIVAGIGMTKEELEHPEPWGYRIHQWEKTDFGVVGKSSAIGTRKKETYEEGEVWAAHCDEEVGNWGVFLPEVYNLYKPVTNPLRNPFSDLSVEGKGRNAKYRFIK